MTGYLTTHVLDTARGCPAVGLKITLYRIDGDSRTQLAEMVTNDDGRTNTPILPQDSFAMDGYQGQAVVVVPSKDLVFVRLGFTPSENPGTEVLVADIISVLEAVR